MDNQRIIDTREYPIPERHQKVFNAFSNLHDGESFVLVNDLDPKPLYYQLGAEKEDRFVWEYLQNGPDVWKVRIGKKDS